MIYKFNNFKVYTEKKEEELLKRIAVMGEDRNGDPDRKNYYFQNAAREFTIFSQLTFLEESDNTYNSVIDDIFDLIDFIETLKAYSLKRLSRDKKYKFTKFSAEIVQREKVLSLKINFNNFSNSLYLDQFECSLLVAKFGKILSKCEAWQVQETEFFEQEEWQE